MTKLLDHLAVRPLRPAVIRYGANSLARKIINALIGGAGGELLSTLEFLVQSAAPHPLFEGQLLPAWVQRRRIGPSGASKQAALATRPRLP